MTPLDKLIENAGWRPISEAPKDGTQILAKGEYGQEISIVRWETPRRHTEYWYCVSDGQTCIESEGDTFTDYKTFTPTHFMPLDTPERMAEVIKVLRDGISGDAEHYEDDDMVSGKTIKRAAKEALAKADEIAGME